MKRLKIFKAYFVLWLFVYFIAISNIEIFKLYFLSTLTFNVAIISILSIGSFMIFKAAKDVTMVTGTFGVLMYKKNNLESYLKGIDKVLPSNIANKIKSRIIYDRLLFTQNETNEILAWMEERFSNQNKYNNFFIGTVLMIGLLGTFSGLLGAIGSMSDIVMSLAGTNVDVGKIMADFAGPLSSMAVGFGSSLFGVISAILLSIKGYLLNKAQESLLEGAENWLNSKTIEPVSDDNKAGAIFSSNTLSESQDSFTDIFIKEISTLSKSMQTISKSHQESQKTFTTLIESINKDRIKQQEIMTDTQKYLFEIAQNGELNNQLLQALLESIEKSNANSKDQIKELSREIQNIKIPDINNDLKKREDIISRMIVKQEKKDEQTTMQMFQIADSLNSLDTNMKKRIEKLEQNIKTPPTKKSSKIEESIDFMKNHFSRVD